MRKIIDWFKNVDIFAFTCYFALVFFLATAIFGCAYSVYKESVLHYDITVSFVNGENQVIHCRSYHKKGDYLYCNVNGDTVYINLKSVLDLSIQDIECDCENT